MKNNCDVSGRSRNHPICRNQEECKYFLVWEDGYCFYLDNNGLCTNLAAIRAAIEAERKPRAGDNCKSCAHASEKLSHPICGPCSYDSRTDTYSNWEPADAGEKGE